MDKLSEHFNWSEFGVSYATDKKIKTNIQILVDVIMEQIRNVYGDPITILSGYRTPEHNKKVGGVANSQHLTGEACDFTGRDFKRLMRIIELMDNNGIINYDQMIIYRRRKFIHISKVTGRTNRNQKIIKR